MFCVYLAYKKKKRNVGNKDLFVKFVDCCVRLSWCTEESENFGLHKTIRQIVMFKRLRSCDFILLGNDSFRFLFL